MFLYRVIARSCTIVMLGLSCGARGANILIFIFTCTSPVSFCNVYSMSTRKTGVTQARPSFASRTAFELLAPASDEDSESGDEGRQEVEEPREESYVIEAYVSSSSIQPFSPLIFPRPKNAKSKNANRAAKPSRLQPQQHEVITPTGSKSNPVHVPDETARKSNGSVGMTFPGGSSSLVSLSSSTHSPGTTSVPISPIALRTRSRSPPATASTFQPHLPPLPTPSEVPIVRKRKASQDLTSNPLPKESKVELGDADYPEDAVDDSILPPPSQKTAEEEKEKKLRNVGTRTLWTLIMISGFLSKFFLLLMFVSQASYISFFIALLAMGHAYMIILVLLCQSVVYREVTSLFTLRGESESEDPWRKTLNWYFFAVTNYFLYGESIIYYFKVRGPFLIGLDGVAS